MARRSLSAQFPALIFPPENPDLGHHLSDHVRYSLLQKRKSEMRNKTRAALLLISWPELEAWFKGRKAQSTDLDDRLPAHLFRNNRANPEPTGRIRRVLPCGQMLLADILPDQAPRWRTSRHQVRRRRSAA